MRRDRSIASGQHGGEERLLPARGCPFDAVDTRVRDSPPAGVDSVLDRPVAEPDLTGLRSGEQCSLVRCEPSCFSVNVHDRRVNGLTYGKATVSLWRKTCLWGRQRSKNLTQPGRLAFYRRGRTPFSALLGRAWVGRPRVPGGERGPARRRRLLPGDVHRRSAGIPD